MMTGVSMMSTPAKGRMIDGLMDRASGALVATDYFEAERLCARALASARRSDDFERLARICMPLQEARRQKRQGAENSGYRAIVDGDLLRRGPKRPGCYLVAPPMIGLDAREFRMLADRRKVPVFVLAREPAAHSGKWPVVAVGDSRVIGTVTIRTQVDPPAGLETKSPAGDRGAEAPTAEWFFGAGEAMGDAAIAKVNPKLPAVYRVDQLMEYLDAFPDHEKLHQRLEEASRAAMSEPMPETRLPRAWLEERYSG